MRCNGKRVELIELQGLPISRNGARSLCDYSSDVRVGSEGARDRMAGARVRHAGRLREERPRVACGVVNLNRIEEAVPIVPTKGEDVACTCGHTAQNAHTTHTARSARSLLPSVVDRCAVCSVPGGDRGSGRVCVVGCHRTGTRTERTPGLRHARHRLPHVAPHIQSLNTPQLVHRIVPA